MAYNRVQAKRLLSGSEMEVFAASLSDRLGSLTATQLAAMIRRARQMRDKAKDLLQRQRVATRARTGSKAGVSGSANERSEDKLAALAQALQRFEDRLAQLEAARERADRKTAAAARRLAPPKQRSAARPAAAKQPPAAKGPARTAPARPGAAGPTRESARQARHAMQFKEAGNEKIQAHISSADRRNQAKRDRRG